jgi:hypothetical protein
MLEGYERAPTSHSYHFHAGHDKNASRDYENASPEHKHQATAAL